MKKTTRLLCIIFIVLMATCLAVACGEPNELTFKTMSVDGTSVDGGVVDNSVTSFRFIDEIETKGKSTYEVGLDEYGISIAVSKIVPLQEGENKFYIFEMVGNNIVNTYVVEIYRKHLYTIIFDTKGAGDIEKQHVQEGDFITPVAEPSKNGYTFDGWDYDFTTPVTAHTKVTAQWTANTNIPYTIEYYIQNIVDDEYTKDDTLTENKVGVTDSFVEVSPIAKTHFAVNYVKSTLEGYVSYDGSLVLKVYYNRIKYRVQLNNSNENRGTVTGEQYVKYGAEHTITATPKDGYKFVGWSDGTSIIYTDASMTFVVGGPVTYTAEWEPRTDTPYTVEYYMQNIEANGYAKDENLTEKLGGTTNSKITITAKDIEGFTYYNYLSTTSGVITADGKLVLKLYYTRNKYDVSVARNNTYGGTISSTGGTYRYGEEITLVATTNSGYTFTGWNDGTGIVSTATNYSFVVKNDTTLTAEWTANTDTPYRVEYYFEDVTSSKYLINDEMTERLKGTTKELVVVEPTDIDGFYYERYDSTYGGYITADKELVLKICYRRNRYTVTFNADGGTLVSGNATQSIKYQGSATAPVFKKTGYILKGFDKEYDYITEAITVKALWEKATYTLTIVYNNGQSDDIFTQEYGSDIQSIVEPEKVGYVFSGWDKEIPAKMPAENLTVTALWDAIFIVEGNTIKGLTDYGKSYDIIDVPIQIDGVEITAIGGAAFNGHRSLRKVSLPIGIQEIGNSAFYACTSLTTVEFSEGCILESIGERAFAYCSVLKDIRLPDSITTIGVEAFLSCDQLGRFNISDNVESIGLNAFRDSRLTEVTVGEGNEFYASIDGSLYTKDTHTLIKHKTSVEVESVIIPSHVTTILSYAFDLCDTYTSVTIPNDVTTIEVYAFNRGLPFTIYCESASKPNGWASNWNIGCPVVWNCNSNNETSDGAVYVIVDGIRYELKNNKATVVEQGTNIEEADIKSVITYNEVDYPVTSIKYQAFNNCNLLTRVTIPASITDIGSSAFASCNALLDIVVDTSNTAYSSIDGNLYNKDATILIQYAKGKTQTEFTVIDSVIEIGAAAFNGCINLEKVIFGTGSKLKSIGDGAFGYCSALSQINLPDGLLTLGGRSFIVCTSLNSIVIPNSVTKIGDYAFSECSNLQTVTISSESNLEIINHSAFNGCVSLEKIFIPDTVTTMGYSVFAQCNVLTICCEAQSVPTGWPQDWNRSNCLVLWGISDASNIQQYQVTQGEATNGPNSFIMCSDTFDKNDLNVGDGEKFVMEFTILQSNATDCQGPFIMGKPTFGFAFSHRPQIKNNWSGTHGWGATFDWETGEATFSVRNYGSDANGFITENTDVGMKDVLATGNMVKVEMAFDLTADEVDTGYIALYYKTTTMLDYQLVSKLSDVSQTLTMTSLGNLNNFYPAFFGYSSVSGWKLDMKIANLSFYTYSPITGNSVKKNTPIMNGSDNGVGNTITLLN